MPSKICFRCKEEKPFSAFNKSKRGKFGLHSYCRECDSANHKRWHLKNREKVLKKVNAWNSRNPEKFAANKRKHKEKHKDHYFEYQKEWAKKNRDKCRLKKNIGIMLVNLNKWEKFLLIL